MVRGIVKVVGSVIESNETESSNHFYPPPRSCLLLGAEEKDTKKLFYNSLFIGKPAQTQLL